MAKQNSYGNATPDSGDYVTGVDISDLTQDAVNGSTKNFLFSAMNTFFAAQTKTLTNTTFDANGTGNSISNIENADISAGAAIDMSKTAFVDGTALTLSGNTLNADSASDTALGVVELATTAETNTGTDTARALTPDGLAGSNYGTAVVTVCLFDDSEDTAVGDGAGDQLYRIPSVLNGFDLVAVAAYVQTAGTTGTTDIQVHNVTQAADMLSTVITIDSGATDSSGATTPAVIDTLNDDVATGDKIRFDVDAVSTTAAKGLWVELQFRLP